MCHFVDLGALCSSCCTRRMSLKGLLAFFGLENDIMDERCSSCALGEPYILGLPNLQDTLGRVLDKSVHLGY